MAKQNNEYEMDYVVSGKDAATGEGLVEIILETKKTDPEAALKREMAFGERLMGVRKHTGLNRKEFAEMLGIPYRTMQDWELGNNPMPDYVYRLIEYRVQHDKLFHKGGNADEENTQ